MSKTISRQRSSSLRSFSESKSQGSGSLLTGLNFIFWEAAALRCRGQCFRWKSIVAQSGAYCLWFLAVIQTVVSIGVGVPFVVEIIGLRFHFGFNPTTTIPFAGSRTSTLSLSFPIATKFMFANAANGIWEILHPRIFPIGVSISGMLSVIVPLFLSRLNSVDVQSMRT